LDGRQKRSLIKTSECHFSGLQQENCHVDEFLFIRLRCFRRFVASEFEASSGCIADRRCGFSSSMSQRTRYRTSLVAVHRPGIVDLSSTDREHNLVNKHSGYGLRTPSRLMALFRSSIRVRKVDIRFEWPIKIQPSHAKKPDRESRK
ncbi:hypothetical protein KCU69_g6, partial [Aureobasidium melanogenum]